jgi:hypothetical protein
MTEKKKPRVLTVLLVLCLAVSVFFGVRTHQLSEQKAQLAYNTLNSQLNYVQSVLVTMEDESQWDTGVSLLGMYPGDIYQVEDRADNQAIVDMLWALQNVWGDHPDRAQIIEGLEELKVSRDSENMTFTILEGDAEAITQLCQYPA